MRAILRDFDAFVRRVEQCGLMLLSRHEGFPSVSDETEDWQWHTGNPDTDPWQWKDRICVEGRAAYSKAFHGRPGFIARDMLGHMIAAKRDSRTLRQRYEDGEIDQLTKRLYESLTEHGPLATHQWKARAELDAQDKKRFDSRVAFLMDEMLVTTCGMTHKVNRHGAAYGWGVTCYDLLERWAGADCMSQARRLAAHQARENIIERIRAAAPQLDEQIIVRVLGL